MKNETGGERMRRKEININPQVEGKIPGTES